MLVWLTSYPFEVAVRDTWFCPLNFNNNQGIGMCGYLNFYVVAFLLKQLLPNWNQTLWYPAYVGTVVKEKPAFFGLACSK